MLSQAEKSLEEREDRLAYSERVCIQNGGDRGGT